MSNRKCLAFDLGAESGRAVLGELDGQLLKLSEIHRFPNEPLLLPDGLHWDALRLEHEIENGLAKAAAVSGPEFAGIAVDTWGVDFAFLGRGDVFLGEPYHYRDHRTDQILAKAFNLMPRDAIYAGTGIQILPFNTLYQLLAMRIQSSPLLECAETLLLMPGLFTYLLTGIKTNDASIASTSQCFDMRGGDWAWDILKRFAIPARFFDPVATPGTIVGPLRRAVADKTGARGMVIAATGHDTASAVAGVPIEPGRSMYISCGTWSLAGVEIPEPIINAQAYEAGFTNEGGADGTICFLKNILGLWLVQECRRVWSQRGEAHDYSELTSLAAKAPAFGLILDPNDQAFLNPADMPSAISAYASRTGQAKPGTVGEFVRAALEGLALSYRRTLMVLEKILGWRIEVIHMVGGGIKNELLCQFTADATGRPVIAGPMEATAAGNILVQAMALGMIDNLSGAREIVRRSFDLRTYDPGPAGPWDEAFARFETLIASGSAR